MQSKPSLQLCVLGPVTVRMRDDPPASSRISQPRHLALLCYLALARPRGLHSRDTLIALLWPDASEQAGRRALRNALYSVRRALGAGAIVSVGDNLVGLDETVICCDALDLERSPSTSDAADDDVPEPLHGLHVHGAAPFDRWMDAERRRLRGLLANRAHTPSVANLPRSTTRSRPLHALDAGGMYERGHYLFLRAAHGGSSDDLLRSREYFERANALDPTFAPAVAGLANFYAVAARRGVLTPFHDTFARTIELSRQAAMMDPTLAVPHVHFAVKALYLDGDWDLAGREFALAVALEPEYAEGRRFYGVWLGLVGRHEDALREMEAAARLEPDIPHILSSLGAARLAVDDRAGAEQALRLTLTIDPRHGPARERLLQLLEDDERFGDAIAERMREPAIPGADAFRAAFAAHGAAGYNERLRDALRAQAEALEATLLERRTPTPSEIFSPPLVRLAAIYTRLGDERRVTTCRLRAAAEGPAMARWFASGYNRVPTRKG